MINPKLFDFPSIFGVVKSTENLKRNQTRPLRAEIQEISIAKYSGGQLKYIGDKENDEQLFIAHGFDKPMTEHEINQQLVELYNRERTIEDERFIEKENKPNLYGISINGYLRSQYTFPPLIADQIVDGFLVGSCRGLKSDVILRIKSCACNMPSIIENLFNVNFEFFKK